MTLDKFFDDLSEADLRQLVGSKVSGCKTVEYQACLPGDTFESQREFLADVSSFANTTGGHLVYGVKEQNGIVTALPGIAGPDPDAEICRLEKLLRDNLQPKCPGITFRVVEMASTAPILIVRIPESWSKPHVVDFQGHWRFYARSSTGKYPLGLAELKSSFLAATGLGERIRSFHFERLTKISGGDLPVPLAGKARTVFHLIPYSAFESGLSISFPAIEDIWSVPLMYAGSSSYRSCLEGLLVYHEKESGAASEGYTQVFRNGIIEAVNAGLLGSSVAGPYLPSATFEADLAAFLDTCLAFYRKLSIRVPAVLFLSLAGVRDYTLAGHRHLDTWHNHVNRIDRDSFLLPEVIVEEAGVRSASLLKPVFQAIWKSLGWERLYESGQTEEKGLRFPREKFAGEDVDVSQVAKAQRATHIPQPSFPT